MHTLFGFLAIAMFVVLLAVAILIFAAGFSALVKGAERLFVTRDEARPKSGVALMIIGTAVTGFEFAVIWWPLIPDYDMFVATLCFGVVFAGGAAMGAMTDTGWSMKQWKRAPSA